MVAVDLPSGVDADTGRVEGEAVRADATVCFGTGKPGLFVDPGAGYAGRVVAADIGLGPDLPAPELEAFDDADVAALLPAPGRDDDKYRRGVLGVAAGSDAYPGAAVLCTGGALRTGTGMVRYLGAESVAARVLDRWPEAVVGRADPGARVAAWVIGPGRGTDAPAAEELRGVFASQVPVLADADALTLIAREEADPSGRGAPTLLTPHAGELARLLGADRQEVEARRLEHVRRAAERFGCTVLLKGAATLVATPGRPVAAATAGTPLLATAGSGDVLAGIAGSLLAAGAAAHEAAVCAAHLHGRAATAARQGAPISATDLWEGIPKAVAGLGGGSR